MIAKRHPKNVFVRQDEDGSVEMKAEDVLQQLEKHEAECTLRYKRIEERLDDHKSSLEKLDLRMWGLAALIIGVAITEHLLK